MIAESLVRSGFEDVLLMDFDIVKTHNLDRLNYATKKDVGRSKVEVLADHLRACATASNFRVDTVAAASTRRRLIAPRWIAISCFRA